MLFLVEGWPFLPCPSVPAESTSCVRCRAEAGGPKGIFMLPPFPFRPMPKPRGFSISKARQTGRCGSKNRMGCHKPPAVPRLTRASRRPAVRGGEPTIVASLARGRGRGRLWGGQSLVHPCIAADAGGKQASITRSPQCVGTGGRRTSREDRCLTKSCGATRGFLGNPGVGRSCEAAESGCHNCPTLGPA